MPKIDWWLPKSEDAKQKLIGKEWWGPVDTYLWYYIGDIQSLTDEETKAIIAQHFVNGTAGFGDVEIHPSANIRGRYLLRLRGKLVLSPMVILKKNIYCPLYQIGHGGNQATKKSPDCINFYRAFGLGEDP